MLKRLGFLLLVASIFSGTISADEAKKIDHKQLSMDVLELVLDSKSFQARVVVEIQNQALSDGYVQSQPRVSVGKTHGNWTQFTLHVSFRKPMKGPGKPGDFGHTQQRLEITGGFYHEDGSDPKSAHIRKVLSVEEFLSPKKGHGGSSSAGR